MSTRGSLVYRMQQALRGVFRPGRRRYHDKKYGRTGMIRGIETMQCMVTDTSQFAHFIQKHWQGCGIWSRLPPRWFRLSSLITPVGKTAGVISGG